MALALLSTAQHVSDVNTSIFRSLRLLGALLWVVVQPTLGYHITNRQSRYITPTCLKSAHYSLHNNAPSSRKLLKMDVLTSETCWAADNKSSAINLVNRYSNIKMMHGPIRIRLITMSLAIRIINLSTRQSWMFSFTPRPLYLHTTQYQ